MFSKRTEDNPEEKMQEPHTELSTEHHNLSRVKDENMFCRPTSFSQQRQCECCHATAVYCCSRCKSAYYCKAQHQRKHWELHRPSCTKKTDGKQLRVKKNANDTRKTPHQKSSNKGVRLMRTVMELSGDNSNSIDVPSLLTYFARRVIVDRYGVLDNFLSCQEASHVAREAKRLYQEYEGSFLPGQTANGEVNDRIRGDYVKWLDQKTTLKTGAMKSLVDSMDALADAICQQLPGDSGRKREEPRSHTDAMLTVYPGNGASYKAHIDSGVDDNRFLTFIYYLNDNYKPESDGGLLRIYHRDSADYIDVEPILNRLIVFASRDVKHEVQPTYRNRFACTVWYLDENKT